MSKIQDPDDSAVYSESIFIDSGAHSLYNINVKKHGERKGRTGRELSPPPHRFGQGDFSYYDLRKGSPFRAYCDTYAKFMRKMEGKDVLIANVDAIGNPDLTWDIQRYFEDEHGLQPIPIVHYGTPLAYVDRYVEATVKGRPKYNLMGLGGIAQGVAKDDYARWGDAFYLHICPASNKRMPVIKTHGFAMTGWALMRRWPWWSVDSASWVRYSAYGWLQVPHWSEDKGWRFDQPPMLINVSVRPPAKKENLDVGMFSASRQVSPREKETQHHYNNIPQRGQEVVRKWIEFLKLPMGRMNKKGEMLEYGVCSHHRARSTANLTYLQMLGASLPDWPYPLDHSVVEKHAVKYRKGFGI